MKQQCSQKQTHDHFRDTKPVLNKKKNMKQKYADPPILSAHLQSLKNAPITS